MRVIVGLILFVALVYCAPPTAFTITTQPGNASSNAIYYTPAAEYFTFDNVVNPVYVSIKYLNGTGSTATSTVCVNSYQGVFPTPGNNFNACPSGGLVTSLNNETAATEGTSKLKFTRKNSSLRGKFLSKMVEDDANPSAKPAYVYPSALNAGLTVTIQNDALMSFTVTITGTACASPEFPVNGDCQTLPTLTTNGSANVFTIPENSTAYYTFVTPEYESTVVNAVVVNVNTTNQILIQKGYLPTSEWYIGSDSETPTPTNTINTPGYFDSPDVFYVSVLNSGTSAVPVSITVNFTVCTNTELIGPGCAVNTTNNNSTSGDNVISLSATLSSDTSAGGSTNTGSSWSFDMSGSDNPLAYFELVDLPTFPNETNDGLPYYVRVSVGNTNLEDDNDNFGPALYAKKNGIPSPESYDYYVSGSVANQAILPVTDLDDKWYVAVAIPSDFSIWVGVNCAGNCSNNEHGGCNCASADGTTVSCESLVNSTYLYPLYQSLPQYTVVSSGYCSCSDDDYDLSYDCSEKSSPTVLFIVLIVIGGLIILFVAIGVPLYCYISNKRKERYERI